MSDLKLSLAITSNPRTQPVISGRIKADGIDFTKSVLGPAEIFWRQLSFAEFDVSEMSMSELMMIRARGDDRFVGIPVFTTRRFYHTGIFVR
ncbi:MAG TPA: ABC transporter substrate-binding protein, partial [Xanthobacteraceae bacterium]|nr:ABC transporter substrate-binding protein [Xanthobacteraceae bacterium]